MKKLALALVAVIMVWLPTAAQADPTPGHAHSTSFHRNIDWD